jgi:hypothetical protein
LKRDKQYYSVDTRSVGIDVAGIETFHQPFELVLHMLLKAVVKLTPTTIQQDQSRGYFDYLLITPQGKGKSKKWDYSKHVEKFMNWAHDQAYDQAYDQVV